MFKKKATAEDTAFNEALTTALTELPSLSADSAEYTAAIKNIEALYSVRSSEKKRRAISADTALVVAGNLAGIIMILGYEKAHVVTSKALSFVLKSKI